MANDLVPMGEDGSLVVSVDSRKAIAGLSSLEARVYGFVHSTESAFNRVSGTMDRFRSKIGSLADGFERMFRRIVGFLAIREVIRMLESFISKIADVNRVFTGFIASMSIIRGSGEAAHKEYQFLLSISDRLGTSIESTISQYHRLAAALKNVDSTGQLARHVFSGISQAALVLQSRGHDTTLIFEAIQQMASKGKLSLEELQRQLGNTLPGAVSMAARAMMNSRQFIEAGVDSVAKSEQFLRKSIQNGTINVYEFLARISNQLKKEYGGGVEYASTQFQANLNRMKNSVFELYRMIGSSGAIEGLVKVMREITALFNDANGGGAAGLGQALGGMFADMAQWISRLSVTDIQEFFASIRGAVTATGITVGAFFELFSGFSTGPVKTPLLDFTEFVARSFAALADVLNTALSGIKMVFYGLIQAFMDARELAFGQMDLTMTMYSKIPFVRDNANVKEYMADKKAREDARAANAKNFADSTDAFAFGNGQPTAYDKVRREFAALREGVLKDRYEGWTLGASAMAPMDTIKPGTKGYFGKAGSSADEAADYINPLGDSELQKLIDSLQGNAPNSSNPKDPSTSQFLREQTRLVKGLATAQNEYQNVLEGKNRKEGQAQAQMESLIQTDERYVNMSQIQKDSLMAWARQLDEANSKVRDAVKAQGAWNDALQNGYAVQRQIDQIREFGYASKYNAADLARDSFKEGGENQYMGQSEKAVYLSAQIRKDMDQRRLDMTQYANSVKLANDEMMFQASLVGLGAKEQQRLTEFRKIDLMVQQLSVGATDDMIKKYKAWGETLKAEVGGALDYVMMKQNSMTAGIQKALADFSDQAADSSKAMYDVASNAFNGLSNLIGQFAATGKADFRSFVLSVISDFARMEARIILSKAFQWIANWAFGRLTGGVTPGYGTAQGNYNWASGSGFGNNYGNIVANAKGNVFSGNPSLSAYSSGVYNTPQFFQQYAKGGVFAEAGPEAIMPLAKDSSGELGVKVKGGMAGNSDVYVTIETNVTTSGSSSQTESSGGGDQAALVKQFSTHLASVAQGEIQKSMRPGGTLWKAGVRA